METRVRRNSKLPSCTTAPLSSSDFKAAYDRMVPYTAAGFRRVCLGAESQRAPAASRDGRSSDGADKVAAA